MATFTYEPEQFKSWATAVKNYLNGESDSIKKITEDFTAQMETLVQPNVWTGPAASQNFENFKDTHNALVQFINNFGDVFTQAMRELNATVQDLETGNLGNAATVNVTLDDYNAIQNLADQNINVTTVKYDYATISNIGVELNKIATNLENVKSSLDSKLGEVGTSSEIWGGNKAENSKNDLKTSLENGYRSVKQNLDICISNIKTAAENASSVDN